MKVEKKARKVNFNNVLIAYYVLGNIKKPLGIIHDNQGKIILIKNEKIIKKVEGIRIFGRKINLTKKWHKIFSPQVIDNTGKGTLFRTTHRLVYIKEPSAWGLAFAGYSFDICIILAREWKKLGFKESLSIPIISLSLYFRANCKVSKP